MGVMGRGGREEERWKGQEKIKNRGGERGRGKEKKWR